MGVYRNFYVAELFHSELLDFSFHTVGIIYVCFGIVNAFLFVKSFWVFLVGFQKSMIWG